jgi:Spy/CpxP family protein refolding chaperone
MKKVKLVIALTLTAFMWIPAKVSLAEDYSICKMCQHKFMSYDTRGKDKNRKDMNSIKDKFFKKAHSYLQMKDELGLNEAQIKQIRDLKIAAKKDVIMKKAAIEVIEVDLQAAIKEETFDIGKFKELLDKKFELKKQKMQNLAEAYGQLKTVLTESQKNKAAEIWIGKHDWKKK